MAALEIFAFLVVFIFICYKFSIRNFDYWKKRNVPYLKPLPFFGNFYHVLTLRAHMSYHLADLYKQFSTPFFGVFILNRPTLIIRSPELIRSILVKDFDYFTDRAVTSDEASDSLASKMIFVVKNPLWRALRTKMTSVFTAGKLKNMTALLNQSAEEMIMYLEKHASEPTVEAKEVCSKYATDVISSCAFGINAHSFLDEKAGFREIGKKMVDLNLKTAIRQLSYFLTPFLVKLFKIPVFDPHATNFLRKAFWNTIHTRNETKTTRHDVVDIMIKIMKDDAAKDGVKFEGETVLAQAAQFFAAGFGTVASTIAFTLFELGLSSEIQNKLRSEIRKVLASHNEINYDAIQEMKYLHMVVCETLRRYPVLPFLDRECIADYRIPDTDVIIEKGTPLFVPMIGLHHDPEYFPNPKVYNPERFSDEHKVDITNFSYIPFGDGPRNCIGERFGLVASKLALVHIISKFVVEKSDTTPASLRFDSRSIFLSPIGGVPLKFSKCSE